MNINYFAKKACAVLLIFNLCIVIYTITDLISSYKEYQYLDYMNHHHCTNGDDELFYKWLKDCSSRFTSRYRPKVFNGVSIAVGVRPWPNAYELSNVYIYGMHSVYITSNDLVFIMDNTGDFHYLFYNYLLFSRVNKVFFVAYGINAVSIPTLALLVFLLKWHSLKNEKDTKNNRFFIPKKTLLGYVTIFTSTSIGLYALLNCSVVKPIDADDQAYYRVHNTLKYNNEDELLEGAKKTLADIKERITFSRHLYNDKFETDDDVLDREIKEWFMTERGSLIGFSETKRCEVVRFPSFSRMGCVLLAAMINGLFLLWLRYDLVKFSSKCRVVKL